MTPARSIPGYKLLHLLGRGHTSLVHLARDPEGRQVALKIPLEETLGTPEAAARFGNEVRLTLQFRHPRLVRGYAGTAFGPRAFVALHYYPGGALSDVLERQPGTRLPLENALRVLADVASGLAHLHRLGAVHQDVKTQNVYLEGGRAALGDLGSAYFSAQGGEASGSPFYMAPEIYRGGSSSPASDVYSLGILAYELLGGERPHQGESYQDLMGAHLTRFAPPLSFLNPEVPRPVARLAELALAKRPPDRPSADALRGALLDSLGEDPSAHESLPDEAPTPRQIGRHGPSAPCARLAAALEPEPEGAGGRWNPFKRRR
ncbi:serine/threonine-protein kinase [Deinococcus budaensis]|uniref:Serine/threonine-protein kinase n=1 Tax=Deinococcus budaensis TaxID=1665626 RepID=A0A7W8LRE0_9DEIO|nr:serine/threonine-protein kinase [Deinococcus budaensis]MBB5235791.1 serine/threonine-protein kinase [Deinococcus budaensis]